MRTSSASTSGSLAFPPCQGAVLVVLDQAVIGVSGERERIEPKGIDPRFVQEPQARIRLLQMAAVEFDEVVSERELGVFCIVVQCVQRGFEVATAMDEGAWHSRTDGGEASNAVGVGIDFEVDGDAPREKRHSPCGVP